jgi:hypothetical protein
MNGNELAVRLLQIVRQLKWQLLWNRCWIYFIRPVVAVAKIPSLIQMKCAFAVSVGRGFGRYLILSALLADPRS